jgi:photosystem II stability/assembly factor-like uncharacterized protein
MLMNIIYNIAFVLLLQLPFAPYEFSVTYNNQNHKTEKTGALNAIFKSTDGGQSWQDISQGLPNLGEEGIGRNSVFANDNGLYLRIGNGIYHSKRLSKDAFWEKEILPYEHGSMVPGNNGIFTYNWDGQISEKINGTDVWLPMFTNAQIHEITTVFETAGGTLFIGTDYCLYRSADKGKTWQRVYFQGWVLKLVESKGVLMATSQKGIIRSSDDGENWDDVLQQGGVGIAIERIKDGFAAITANTHLIARTVNTSYDEGKTWQPIDEGLPQDLRIASIIEVGEDFYCGHPQGIFKSSDKGKTWKLVLPSIENKVSYLYFSGDVIYAIPGTGGC